MKITSREVFDEVRSIHSKLDVISANFNTMEKRIEEHNERLCKVEDNDRKQDLEFATWAGGVTIAVVVITWVVNHFLN